MRSITSRQKDWCQKQRELPLDELVEGPNCKMYCPPGCISCCANYDCAGKNGFFTEDELKERFSVNEREEIKRLFDAKTGFLSGDGCVLPRRLRSEICLRHICNGCQPPETELRGL